MNTDQQDMVSDLVNLPAVNSLAEVYQITSSALVGTFASVAMPKQYTKGELISCILVAKEHGLNPLTREIYFMRTKSGAIQPIVGVDGWIRKCNESPEFDGMEFSDVRDDKGELIAMSCSIYRKDRSRPTTVTEDLEECSKNGGPVWKTMPKRMLRNRVICQAVRLAFGFAGAMDPDEFHTWQGSEPQMKDVTPKRKSSAAAKRDGDDKKFNELVDAIQSAPTTLDLREMFQEHANGNTPWADFPRAWADLLQENFDARYEDLSAAEQPISEAAE